MDIDDLKRQWAEQEACLDRTLRLNERLVREATAHRARGALLRLSRWILVEAVVGALVLLWLGSFIIDFLTEPRFLGPAAWLFAGQMALLTAQLRQVVAIRTFDEDAPVPELQERLELLRMGRLRTVKWTFLLAPLAWAPLLVVGLAGLFRLDAYAILGTRYLSLNALVGLLCIPAGLAIARFLQDRTTVSPWLRRLAATLTDRNLSEARRFLDRLREFQT